MLLLFFSGSPASLPDDDDHDDDDVACVCLCAIPHACPVWGPRRALRPAQNAVSDFTVLRGGPPERVMSRLYKRITFVTLLLLGPRLVRFERNNASE